MSRSMKPIPNRFVQSVFDTWAGVMNGLDGELVVGDPHRQGCLQRDHQRGDGAGRASRGHLLRVRSLEPATALRRPSQPSVSPEHDPRGRRSKPSSLASGSGRCRGRVLHPSEELEAYEAEITSQGYEGVMLRAPGGPYKQGRSTLKEGYLLKLKRWEDHEAQVIGFEERMQRSAIQPSGRARLHQTQLPQGGPGRHEQLWVHWLSSASTGPGLASSSTLVDRASPRSAAARVIWRRQNELRLQIINYTHFPIGAIDKPRLPTFRGFRDPSRYGRKGDKHMKKLVSAGRGLRPDRGLHRSPRAPRKRLRMPAPFPVTSSGGKPSLGFENAVRISKIYEIDKALEFFVLRFADPARLLPRPHKQVQAFRRSRNTVGFHYGSAVDCLGLHTSSASTCQPPSHR